MKCSATTLAVIKLNKSAIISFRCNLLRKYQVIFSSGDYITYCHLLGSNHVLPPILCYTSYSCPRIMSSFHLFEPAQINVQCLLDME